LDKESSTYSHKWLLDLVGFYEFSLHGTGKLRSIFINSYLIWLDFMSLIKIQYGILPDFHKNWFNLMGFYEFSLHKQAFQRMPAINQTMYLSTFI